MGDDILGTVQVDAIPGALCGFEKNKALLSPVILRLTELSGLDHPKAPESLVPMVRILNTVRRYIRSLHQEPKL